MAGKKKKKNKKEIINTEMANKEEVKDSIEQEVELTEEKVEANEEVKEQPEAKEGTEEKEEIEQKEELEEKVVIKEENLDYKDKYLRLSAEFDNYRKRTLKEKMDLTKTAGEKILKDLLPVIDDLDRALDSIEQAKDIDAVKGGIELIHNKFNEFLGQKGIKEIEAKNVDFDTDIHEALTKIPAPEESLKGKVVDVIQKGYYLHDKVVRFSKVVIGE